MELRDLAKPIWQRKWIVLLVFILTLGIAAVYLAVAPKKYESTATLAFTPRVSETPSDSLVPAAVASLLGTYAVVAKSESVTNRAEKISKHPLAGTLTTSPRLETGILEISDRASSPVVAAQTASVVARAFIGSLKGNGLVEAKVVDPARVEHAPVSPQRSLTIGIAIFLGLAAGCMTALTISHFRRRLRTSADVTEIGDITVLATIPRENLKRRGMARGQGEILESMRVLRTNLQLPRGGSPQSLLVTSPAGRDGSSTVVANLGVALSQIGVSTTILDANLRRPLQHSVFGLENDHGLSTVLREWTTYRLAPSVEPQNVDDFPNLAVLTAGPDPGAATELLPLRLNGVIEKLLSVSSVVFIDSPAVLPYADARIISAVSNSTLLVVNARRTRPEELREALDCLRIAKGIVGGVVINQVSSTEGISSIGNQTSAQT